MQRLEKLGRVFQVPEIRSDKPDAVYLGTQGGLEPEDWVPGKAAYSLSPAVICVADSSPSIAAAASGQTQSVNSGTS